MYKHFLVKVWSSELVCENHVNTIPEVLMGSQDTCTYSTKFRAAVMLVGTHSAHFRIAVHVHATYSLASHVLEIITCMQLGNEARLYHVNVTKLP